MSILFSADDIFEIALQIERNGIGFYNKAAEGITAPDTRRMLLDLAAMEERHEQIFASMREELSAQEKEQVTFDPYDEIILYLRAFADEHVFRVNKEDLSESLTGKETVEDILLTAIGLEKDSIVFYTGMTDYIPENLGKGQIDKIIKEEMSHLARLTKELESYSPNNSGNI
jgi:rubrerythrin